MNGSAALDQKIDSHRQLQSLFATAQVGYKESAYIDLTARNDWSSTLSHTKHEGRGYFYPSVGTSLILSRLLTLPEWVSYAKVRAAYSMVGNDIPLYITNSASHITAGGEYLANVRHLSRKWNGDELFVGNWCRRTFSEQPYRV